jgi:hypothetical protein
LLAVGILQHQTPATRGIVRELVQERAMSPTGALAGGTLPLLPADVDLRVAVLEHIVHVVEVQVRDEDVADIIGRQAELAQLSPAALVRVLGDRLARDVRSAAIHLGDIGQSGVHQDGLVAAQDQPEVQSVVEGLRVVAAIERMIAGELADAVAQRIGPVGHFACRCAHTEQGRQQADLPTPWEHRRLQL